MKFKLKDYHISYKADLIRNLNTYPNKHAFEVVAEVAASTGCHILALMLFLRDIVGGSEAINVKIEDIKKFYQISEIIL